MTRISHDTTRDAAALASPTKVIAQPIASVEPEPITGSVAEIRNNFGDYLSRAHYQDERIVIEKYAKPFAFVGSIKAKETLDELDAIARSFNVSSGELIEWIRKVANSEKARQELVGTVKRLA